MKLWGGRFQKDTDLLVNELNASISFDQRLLREDTLTAGEAMDLGGAWTLPWAEGAAYTLSLIHI